MPATPQIRGASGASIEYRAIGLTVWRITSGNIYTHIATCGSAAAAQSLAIELAIIEYVQWRSTN